METGFAGRVSDVGVLAEKVWMGQADVRELQAALLGAGLRPRAFGERQSGLVGRGCRR